MKYNSTSIPWVISMVHVLVTNSLQVETLVCLMNLNE